MSNQAWSESALAGDAASFDAITIETKPDD
jgi:hypothetical protein